MHPQEAKPKQPQRMTKGTSDGACFDVSDQIVKGCKTAVQNAHADMSMKNMAGKQERKAKPRINLEKEDRKCASAVTESV